MPLPPSQTKDPNRDFPIERIDAAARVINPFLPKHPPPPPSNTEYPDHLLLAARTRVRMVIAALNGADVEADLAAINTAQYDTWTIMPRELLIRVAGAMCDPRVASALSTAIGVEEANRLLDQVARSA
jgi:hypothetical protein